MARSRNIKPGFFQNEELVEIEPIGRLLYIGLWCLADREGRLEDRPKKIKAMLFPYESWNVDSLLNDLMQHNFIIRYQVEGESYIWIPKFNLHQNPHPKEKLSVIPPVQEEIAELNGKTITSREKQHARNADSLQSDSLQSDILIPDSTDSCPSDATESEREILKELKAVKGYKFNYQTELDFIRKLAVDFPKIDLQLQIKKWCAGKIDDPLKAKSKPHSQLTNWFGMAEKWRKEKESNGNSRTSPQPSNTGEAKRFNSRTLD